jgi:L-fuconolactonase
MKIDSHQHFWNYNSAEYGWIDDSMSVLNRDFLPEHLQTEIANAGVDGVVSVQARQNVMETNWLLELAGQNDFIKGVVGWVDLVSPNVFGDLERFTRHAKFKSVRHVIQAEPDDQFILRDDFNRGIRALKPFNLVYDILIFERHLPMTIQFADLHPDQIFALDHIAKPLIKAGAFEPWNRNIRKMAKRPNVYCKLSGMVTEANYSTWTESQLRPYFETVLEAFGPRRLMFGSDWPVCLAACDYGRWAKIVAAWIAGLSTGEQARIFGSTAAEVYNL